MTISNLQICSNDGWKIYEIPGSKPKPYDVLVQRPDDEDGVICPCNGFRYTGTCKHVRIALDLICTWSENDGPEVQTDEERRNRTCPRCGSPTNWILEWQN